MMLVLKRTTNDSICLLRDDNGKITSDYGLTYEKLSKLLLSGHYEDSIKDNDYIEVICKDGYTHYLYANIDTYYKCGDSKYRIGHHIDFISKDLIPGSKGWQMRITNTNNGCEHEKSPFLSSSSKYGNTGIIDKLNSYYETLPSELKKYIVDKYLCIPYRYNSSGDVMDNGSRWKPVGKLWLPYEREIFGDNKHANEKYESAMKQYSSFKNIKDFKIKYDYANSTSVPVDWWTASTEKELSEMFCCVTDKGSSKYIYASYSNNGIPLCFRFQ